MNLYADDAMYSKSIWEFSNATRLSSYLQIYVIIMNIGTKTQLHAKLEIFILEINTVTQVDDNAYKKWNFILL